MHRESGSGRFFYMYYYFDDWLVKGAKLIMNALNVVILAAGKGTRMYSETPKVLHSLAGRPLLQHVLDTALGLSASQLCVIYGHGGEAVPKMMAGYDAAFVLQEPQLGTGHAVQQALPQLKDDSVTLVLYGDVPLLQVGTLKKMLDTPQALTLLTVFLDNPSGYGRILRDRSGKVSGIVEEKDASTEQRALREVNTGILSVPTHFLRHWLSALRNENAQGEYYLTDIVAMAAAQGVDVHTVHPGQEWEILGVNNKMQLAELERIWQKNHATELLLKGVTLADPARLDVRGRLKCGRDVEIDVGCVFVGDVQLGDGVKIGAYSIIRNTCIGKHSRVEPYSHIDEAKIGSNCRIGPYARLRPGSQLHTDVHIGNFVEVKNSEFSSSSKANHLSYIGDASVGTRVNIGAGTITCNYDGVNKHRTIIEEDAFIGSNTQLVAPVKIGRGATIGAGSTITRDAPEGELTLARSRQTTLKGWRRPQKKK